MSEKNEKEICKHEPDCPKPYKQPFTTMYDKGNGQKYEACYHCYAPVVRNNEQEPFQKSWQRSGRHG